MLCNQKGSQEAFAALRQGGEEPQCSGGFGWGYSEKVPNATGSHAEVEPAFQAICKGGGRHFRAVATKPVHGWKRFIFRRTANIAEL